ncbi:hypothetical protein [Streptomyces sp. NPDC059452]|uniref:hypothetical protein n=1 Tax=Streptomyces sp. NPDC059452 TaxID=3346835 RepID=UPI0036C94468
MAKWQMFSEKPTAFDWLVIIAGSWTAASSVSPLWVRVLAGATAAHFAVNMLVHRIRRRRLRATGTVGVDA